MSPADTLSAIRHELRSLEYELRCERGPWEVRTWLIAPGEFNSATMERLTALAGAGSLHAKLSVYCSPELADRIRDRLESLCAEWAKIFTDAAQIVRSREDPLECTSEHDCLRQLLDSEAGSDDAWENGHADDSFSSRLEWHKKHIRDACDELLGIGAAVRDRFSPPVTETTTKRTERPTLTNFKAEDVAFVRQAIEDCGVNAAPKKIAERVRALRGTGLRIATLYDILGALADANEYAGKRENSRKTSARQ